MTALHTSPSIRQIGDQLPGGYRIFDVRRGGMGIVYCVSNPGLAYRFAVKTFKDEYLLDPAAVKRFRREAQAWIGLGRHPHLVQAVAVYTIDNKPHLFLEYVEGGNLAEEIGDKGIPLVRALDVGLQICDGMIHIQRMGGLVHRDIKPSNILLASDGRAQITDFGLVSVPGAVATDVVPQNGLSKDGAECATIADDPSPGARGERLTVTGSGMGTATYMPPEQWQGIATVRSDVYAFGVTLYEVLCGRPPFAPEPGEPEYILRAKHATVTPPDIRSFRRDLPGGLTALIHRCLEKPPENRPADFAELRHALLATYSAETGHTWQPPSYSQLPYVDDLTASLIAGKSLAALGNYREAIAEIRKAVEMDPSNGMGQQLLGKYHYMLGEYSQALAHLERAQELLPADADSYDLLALCLNAMKRFKEASKHGLKATKIEPRGFSGWNNLACSLLGLAFEAELRALRNEEEAGMLHTYTAGLDLLRMSIDAVDAAIGLHPTSAECWSNRGYALGRCGSFSDAVAAFRRSISLNPRHMPAYLNLSEVLIVDGEAEEAFRTLAAAAAIDPDDTRVQNMFTVVSRYLAGQGRDTAVILETPMSRLPPKEGEDHVDLELADERTVPDGQQGT